MPSERDKAKTKRWWQFGIRDLLLFILVAAVATGWWIDHEQAQQQLTKQRAEVRRIISWENKQFAVYSKHMVRYGRNEQSSRERFRNEIRKRDEMIDQLKESLRKATKKRIED